MSLSYSILSEENSILVNQAVLDRVPINYGNFNANTEVTINNSRICGFPGFCQHSAYEECLNTTIISCRKCGISRAVLFMFFVAVLGLAILVGNIIILMVGWHRHKKKTSNKIDLCRNSLAIADLLTAIEILVVTVYNFSWTINSTSRQLDLHQLKLRNSASAYIGGILYLLGFTSSIYHLLYLGLLRLYAVRRPFKYRLVSHATVFWGLGLVWLLSGVSASIPAWLPRQFAYSYEVPLLQFLPGLENVSSNPDFTPTIVLVAFFVIIPYVLMTITTVMSCVFVICHQRRTTRKLSEATSRPLHGHLGKKEICVCKTVTVMQIGFSITLVPVIVVISLIHSSHLNCSNYSIPYVVCFYLSMSNSLVNVIVYNLRDKSFRSSIVEVFRVSSILDQRNHQHANRPRSQELEFSSTIKIKSIKIVSGATKYRENHN